MISTGILYSNSLSAAELLSCLVIRTIQPVDWIAAFQYRRPSCNEFIACLSFALALSAK